MAGVDGFEPSSAGTKNQCLAAWLHPNLLSSSQVICFLQIYFEFKRVTGDNIAEEIKFANRIFALGKILLLLSGYDWIIHFV